MFKPFSSSRYATQAENERSLALLHEYLSLARGGDARSPAARVAHRFVFFTAATAGEAAAAVPGEAAAGAQPRTAWEADDGERRGAGGPCCG